MAQTNQKASQYVSCWLCDHFQRYDESDEPESCLGECRLKPQWGSLIGIAQTDPNPPDPYLRIFQWTVIPNADAYYCDRFIRTREKNLPAVPQNCPDPTPGEINDAQVAFNDSPWNKKTRDGYVSAPEDGVACWNCDHCDYQAPVHGDGGRCVAYPPPPVMNGNNGLTILFTPGYSPVLSNAPCLWCAQWERAEYNVPEPINGWLCEERL